MPERQHQKRENPHGGGVAIAEDDPPDSAPEPDAPPQNPPPPQPPGGPIEGE